jgi:hypothetical protein
MGIGSQLEWCEQTMYIYIILRSYVKIGGIDSYIANCRIRESRADSVSLQLSPNRVQI